MWKTEGRRVREGGVVMKTEVKVMEAGRGGSHQSSQHCRRLRLEDHLRSGVGDQPGQHGETLSLLKIQKLVGAWWQAPIIPATWEVEAGESLEPRRWSLQ